MDHSPFLFTAQAANSAQITTDPTQIAVCGLIKLMARAEVQTIASRTTANGNQPPKELS